MIVRSWDEALESLDSDQNFVDGFFEREFNHIETGW